VSTNSSGKKWLGWSTTSLSQQTEQIGVAATVLMPKADDLVVAYLGYVPIEWAHFDSGISRLETLAHFPYLRCTFAEGCAFPEGGTIA
jgi:hypothetical protein